MLSTRGLVVKYGDAAELRVVAAAVLAVAADAVLVAQQLLKLGAHLVIALACLHVHDSCAKKQPVGGKHAREKSGEERKNVRNSKW